jgi:hypothetical protein
MLAVLALLAGCLSNPDRPSVPCDVIKCNLKGGTCTDGVCVTHHGLDREAEPPDAAETSMPE